MKFTNFKTHLWTSENLAYLQEDHKQRIILATEFFLFSLLLINKGVMTIFKEAFSSSKVLLNHLNAVGLACRASQGIIGGHNDGKQLHRR